MDPSGIAIYKVQQRLQTSGRYKVSAQDKRKTAQANREHHKMLNLQHPETQTREASVNSQDIPLTKTRHPSPRLLIDSRGRHTLPQSTQYGGCLMSGPHQRLADRIEGAL